MVGDTSSVECESETIYTLFDVVQVHLPVTVPSLITSHLKQCHSRISEVSELSWSQPSIFVAVGCTDSVDYDMIALIRRTQLLLSVWKIFVPHTVHPTSGDTSLSHNQPNIEINFKPIN